MVADPVSDAWMEIAFISISKQGGTERQFAGIISTISFDGGTKDITGIPLTNGGRIASWQPQEDISITFDAYALEAGTDTGSVGKGFWDLMHSSDSSVPIRILADHNRDKHRILVLWTNDPAVTGAQNIIAANKSAKRYGIAEAYITEIKEDFTDNILKTTITAKATAFSKDATSNWMAESCAGASSDALPAIAAYTTSNKFG